MRVPPGLGVAGAGVWRGRNARVVRGRRGLLAAGLGRAELQQPRAGSAGRGGRGRASSARSLPAACCGSVRLKARGCGRLQSAAAAVSADTSNDRVQFTSPGRYGVDQHRTSSAGGIERLGVALFWFRYQIVNAVPRVQLVARYLARRRSIKSAGWVRVHAW